MEKLGIDRFDANGRRLDFHGLRTTYNTNLAKANIGQAVHMKLMRVSDRRLIDQTYLDASQLPVIDAMDRLPRYDAGQAAEAPTDPKSVEKTRAQKRVQKVEKRVQSAVSDSPKMSADVQASEGLEKQNRPEKLSGSTRLNRVVRFCPAGNKNSAGRTRTYNQSVNSRLLYH